jgi:hypothetical protein
MFQNKTKFDDYVFVNYIISQFTTGFKTKLYNLAIIKIDNDA